MTFHHSKQAVAVFSDRKSLEQGLRELEDIGFSSDKISVIAGCPAAQLQDQAGQESAMTRSEGARVGAILGGTGAGFMTLAAGCLILLVPGVGPVLALESFLTTVLGGGVAAAIGGLYGGLRGWFMPEEQARVYSNTVNQGHYLVVVKANEEDIHVAQLVLNRQYSRIWHIYDVV